MRKVNENINSREYLNEVYSGNWQIGYKDAYKRLDMVIELAGEHESHLDIGCADGYFTREYKKKYPNSHGVGLDISDVVVSQAKKLGGGTFMVGDIYHLPFKDQEFELVVMSEILEHLEDPEKAIREAERVAKKEIIISTPFNGGSDYKEHIYSWIPDEVIKMLTFKPIKTDPNWFNGNILLIIAQR